MTKRELENLAILMTKAINTGYFDKMDTYLSRIFNHETKSTPAETISSLLGFLTVDIGGEEAYLRLIESAGLKDPDEILGYKKEGAA